MNRLTGRMENNDPYYPHCYESNCDSNCAACDFDYEVLEKLTAYEDLEEKLEKVYGECDDLLKVVVNGLVKHEGAEIGKPKKARLLTDEDVDKWEDLKNDEEQGLLLRLPCKVGDVLWCTDNKKTESFIVKEFKICAYKINRVEIYFENASGFGLCLFDGTLDEGWFLTKEEAEQALARMEGNNG